MQAASDRAMRAGPINLPTCVGVRWAPPREGALRYAAVEPRYDAAGSVATPEWQSRLLPSP